MLTYHDLRSYTLTFNTKCVLFYIILICIVYTVYTIYVYTPQYTVHKSYNVCSL